ncbi:MAG: hypothetical protein VYC38_13170 [Pseudomonadota bacterium]|nr:hypothetical protein [Pseudomonadota bacterium]
MTSDYKTGPILVLELNELCPPILNRMMDAGDLPNFRKLHDSSDVYVTHTDDPTLEPWVQWPSFHTGQPESVHGAQELDEGHIIQTPRIWDRLAETGVDSIVFGSMNADSAHKDTVFLVPDPWSAGVRPSDPAYDAFHKFISFHVAEHTNPNARPTRADALNFVKFMLGHGLSLKTITTAMSQIAGEKTSSGDRKWRRALVLDWMLWDVFANTWSSRRPKFATFFANSTAFLQHRYWRHMEPDAYQVKPSEREMADFGDAVEDSYRHMDTIVGKAFDLVGPSGRIILATALSQEANTRYEHIGGKFVYRPHSFKDLFAWAGGPQPTSFEPVMTHQAWASFASEDAAIEAEATLDALQSNGKTIMEWRRTGNRVMFWCGLISRTEPGFELTHAKTGKSIAFDDLFMLVGQVNNSQHCRDGAFWVQSRDGSSRVHADKLPLEHAYGIMMDMFDDAPQAGTRVAAE